MPLLFIVKHKPHTKLQTMENKSRVFNYKFPNSLTSDTLELVLPRLYLEVIWGPCGQGSNLEWACGPEYEPNSLAPLLFFWSHIIQNVFPVYHYKSQT